VQAALGAPVTTITNTDAGKILVAIEYDAASFALKSGFVTLTGVQATDTAASISLANITAKPTITATFAASVAITGKPGTAIATKTATINLTNAKVKTELSNVNIKDGTWGIDDGEDEYYIGLTFKASAAANATAITITIAGTPEEAELDDLYIEVPDSVLNYTNGTAVSNVYGTEVTGTNKVSFSILPDPIPLPATTGKLTITGASALNGKYVMVSGGSDDIILLGIGGTTLALPNITGVLVSGGSVVIPLYTMGTNNSVSGYNGSDEDVAVMVLVSDTATIDITTMEDMMSSGYMGQVSFTSGVGTVAFNTLQSMADMMGGD
jgi:hypothetical protein